MSPAAAAEATVFKITVKEVQERAARDGRRRLRRTPRRRKTWTHCAAWYGSRSSRSMSKSLRLASSARCSMSSMSATSSTCRPAWSSASSTPSGSQIENDAKRTESEIASFLDQPEDEAREEFRQIAERRVRLGLLIAEIGRSNDITVEQEDLLRAAMMRAREHPEPSAPPRILYRKLESEQPDQLERFRPPRYSRTR